MSTEISPLSVLLPDGGLVDQDHEWCEVTVGARTERIRFHDYARIYSIPGLYEHLFYDRLECCSPEVVSSLLQEELAAEGVDPARLSVLDLGAGNGMVGEQLREMGVASIVGIDLIPEAAEAAERDRPGLYRDDLVLDLCELGQQHRRELRGHDFNCLVTVAALGFGDIPPRAFAEAFNLVKDGGLIAFNIKEHFLDEDDPTGFSLLIGRLLETGVIEQRAEKVYRHRLATNGDALDYVALVGVKRGDVPADFVADAERP